MPAADGQATVDEDGCDLWERFALGLVDVENMHDSKPHHPALVLFGDFGFDVADDGGEDHEGRALLV